MPSKNILKPYIANTYYHIYNRGVEKRTIFQDNHDYKIFLYYLRIYLTLPQQGQSLQVTAPSRQLKNYSEVIDLNAYILMPNHFHLLVYQKTPDAIRFFIQSLNTKYVKLFNKKYSRVGPLFQSRYKAVPITSKEQLIYNTKYIHRNCLELNPNQPTRSVLVDYPFSSYQNYLGTINQFWVKPQPILETFSETHPTITYESYVEEESDDGQSDEDKGQTL